MAEELTVIVQQEPGVVRWNFDDLKNALAARMQEYEGLVYTDDTVQAAKADVAMLRKLRKTVEDRRKEIKTKCLEPYAIIEAQANELTDLIDRPIGVIDAQVKTYETARRQAVKDEIVAYMAKKFAELPDGIGKKLQFKIYDERWENATAKKREWQEAVDAALEATKGDLAILDDVEEEFREKALSVYSVNLTLSEAMAKVSELRKQKEEILERERQRREAEERRRLEEAQRKQYEAERAAQDAQNGAQMPPAAETVKVTPPEEKPSPAPAQAAEPAPAPAPKASEPMHTIVFRVTGSKEQLNRIYAFIKASGAAMKWKEEPNV